MNRINWNRNDLQLSWNDIEINLESGVLWLAELPQEKGFCVVTMFDEYTPEKQSNAFVYDWQGRLIKRFFLEENGSVVRFIGCGIVGEELLVLDGANNTKYFVDFCDWQVVKEKYFR